MEAVKSAGAHVASHLQSSWLANHAYTLHRATHYSSPGFLLTVLCPVLFALQGAVLNKNVAALDGRLAHSVLWTIVVCIRLNIIKQWTFGEDRPYWWVKETSRFVDQRAPDLRHFPVTCLTSPASPLFALLATAVGLVLVSAAIKFIKSLTFRDEKKRRWCTVALWLAYVGYASTVAVAEILFSANFLHQVIISVIIGLAIGRIAIHNNFWKADSAKKIIFVNAVILVAMNLVLWKRDAVGSFNEYQKLAFKWCQRREWMQIDPVPLLDVFLYTGYAVGVAFCSKSVYFKRLNKPKFTLKMLVSLVVLNLASSIFLSVIFDAIPRSFVQPYVYAWYATQMMTGVLITYVCGAVVPYFVQKVSGVSSVKLK